VPVRYDGCLALALGLQKNHSLTSLELPRNRVGDDGADALAAGASKHRTERAPRSIKRERERESVEEGDREKEIKIGRVRERER